MIPKECAIDFHDLQFNKRWGEWQGEPPWNQDYGKVRPV
jgi:hypothetical protein